MMDFDGYQNMMGGWAASGMWFIYILVVAALVLAIAALAKYLIK